MALLALFHEAVDISPPYAYKEKPYEGLLPDLPGTPRDYRCAGIPGKVDKMPRVGQVPKLPPLPSITEQEGLVTWFEVTLTDTC